MFPWIHCQSIGTCIVERGLSDLSFWICTYQFPFQIFISSSRISSNIYIELFSKSVRYDLIKQSLNQGTLRVSQTRFVYFRQIFPPTPLIKFPFSGIIAFSIITNQETFYGKCPYSFTYLVHALPSPSSRVTSGP